MKWLEVKVDAKVPKVELIFKEILKLAGCLVEKNFTISYNKPVVDH